MVNRQVLNRAKRCQLLTGSYEGAQRSCQCEKPTKCYFLPLDRKELKDHPAVVEARERNLKEFMKGVKDDNRVEDKSSGRTDRKAE